MADIPPLGAVSGKPMDAIRAGIVGAHLRKQCAVEGVVVPVCEEEIVPRERGVGFERVVRGQAAFGAEEGAQGAEERRFSCGIAADGQSCGDDVAVNHDAKDGEEYSQVVRHLWGRVCIRDDEVVGRIGGRTFHMFCCAATSSLNVVIPSRLQCDRRKSKLIYASRHAPQEAMVSGGVQT